MPGRPTPDVPTSLWSWSTAYRSRSSATTISSRPASGSNLFVPVCQAIQHAHQKGIIHRDIKPSNVLVTMYDDRPVPKVIDFGVAKAVEQRLTERTLFTQFGALVGTFEYMSPEQAEMNAFGVDTRSDIYSLGVLLYELLTGTTPLEKQRLRQAALGEMVRLIKEEEPPRPSARLSDSGDLPKIAAARRTEPARLSKLVRGEVDWIVMKCLEKDRSRRYETAIGLARDVERYLNDEPVEACPPSAGYRLRKFAAQAPDAAWRRGGGGRALAGWPHLQQGAGHAGPAGGGAGPSRGAAGHGGRASGPSGAAGRRGPAGRGRGCAAIAAAVAVCLGHATGRGGLGVGRYPPDARPAGWTSAGAGHARPARLRVALPARAGHERSRRHAGPGRDVRTAQPRWNAVRLRGHALPTARAQMRARRSSWSCWTSAHSGRSAGSSPFPGESMSNVHVPLTFSPDGSRFLVMMRVGDASGRYSWRIKVFDWETGRGVCTLADLGGVPGAAAFDRSGKRLAAVVLRPDDKAGSDLMIWDLDGGKRRLAIPLPGRQIVHLYSVAFSPDGTRVAALTKPVGSDASHMPGEVRAWDAGSGEERLRFETGPASAALAYSPDGKYLAEIGSGGASHRLRDADSGKERLELISEPTAAMSFAIAFSPDGSRLAVSSQDSKVRIWDVTDAETGGGRAADRILDGKIALLTHVAWSADGRKVFASSDGGTLMSWPVAAREPDVAVRGSGQTDRITATAAAAASRFAAAFEAPDGKTVLKVWDEAGRVLFTADVAPAVLTTPLLNPKKVVLSPRRDPRGLPRLGFEPIERETEGCRPAARLGCRHGPGGVPPRRHVRRRRPTV